LRSKLKLIRFADGKTLMEPNILLV
jgi:hypothetical protein